MTLNNIKQLRKDRGFTIVELLIVIIVIAILAAIVIVAYQGITAKANTSKAQTSAVSVQKKAEAFNADTANGNGNYAATATALQAGTGIAAPTAGITVVGPGGTAGTAPAATVFTGASNPSATVVYSACVVSGAAVGYYVAYYDFSQSKVVYIVGGATIAAGANNTTYPTVTGCTMSTT